MALSGDERISAKTRSIVAETATRLGYQPNRMARAMRTGRSGLLGVIVPSLRVSFFTDIVESIERNVSPLGLRILVTQATHGPAQFDREIELFLAQQVDALVLTPINPFADSIYRSRLADLGPAVVLINNPGLGPQVPGVVSDEPALGQAAADLLLSHGHRRIACLHVVPRTQTTPPRIASAATAIKAAGGTAQLLAQPDTAASFQDYIARAAATLGQPAPPSAFLCSDDHMAAAVVRAAAQRGLSVPAALSVVSCAALDLGRWSTPPITSIDQQPDRIGVAAVNLIQERLAGREPAVTTLVPGIVTAGESIARFLRVPADMTKRKPRKKK